jgi:hypothetical protein
VPNLPYRAPIPVIKHVPAPIHSTMPSLHRARRHTPLWMTHENSEPECIRHKAVIDHVDLEDYLCRTMLLKSS